MSLVQGHCKDVSIPVPILHLLGALLGKLRLGALVPHPVALLMHLSLCPQVHSACKELFGKRCPLGQYKVSIIPPTALNSIDSDGESERIGLGCGWRGQPLGQGCELSEPLYRL